MTTRTATATSSIKITTATAPVPAEAAATSTSTVTTSKQKPTKKLEPENVPITVDFKNIEVTGVTKKPSPVSEPSHKTTTYKFSATLSHIYEETLATICRWLPKVKIFFTKLSIFSLNIMHCKKKNALLFFASYPWLTFIFRCLNQFRVTCA